jgi:polyisoprenoid-binding protein YceI
MKKLAARSAQTGVLTVALTSVGLAAMAAQGAWRTYIANDPIGRNVVMIESRAPLETMLTRTNKVTGEIKLDEKDILQNPSARFEVDMTSLDTGIELRNEHMMSAQWLDTAKYPTAVFTLTKIGARPKMRYPITQHRTATVKGEGTLNFHGVTKTIPVQIEATPIAATKETAARLPGDLLHVRAKFTIVLSDYGVNVPAAAQLKVSNNQNVTVDVFTSTEQPTASRNEAASAPKAEAKPTSTIIYKGTQNMADTKELKTWRIQKNSKSKIPGSAPAKRPQPATKSLCIIAARLKTEPSSTNLINADNPSHLIWARVRSSRAGTRA